MFLMGQILNVFNRPILMGPLNVIFTNQFKWAPYNTYLNGPSTKIIDPGGPNPLNINFANQFKWAPNNYIFFAPNLNGPPTIILTQWTLAPSI